MDGTVLPELAVLEHLVQPLLSIANCSILNSALENLISSARTEYGRSALAADNIIPLVLELGVVRLGLQLLGNVSLAGEEHQRAVWYHFFPGQYMEIARIWKSEICDALCMVIYTCHNRSKEREAELCGVQVGFAEDWFQWLVSKLCLEESHFPTFFCQLGEDDVVSEDLNCKVAVFSEEQAFLLGVLSEVLNQQTDDIPVSNECIMCVLGILKKGLVIVDFSSRGISGLPTGIRAVDVLAFWVTRSHHSERCLCKLWFGY
ncbi:hypothetical protein IFM89_020908 [Coptis chinensis]|uniref:Uncharacterized protein n=1 Tax=Coptis chinensis TaxID=261450 RepID=A0A835LSA8_9MAGN|nr:hypothetical protein IFM89_020908 [Coptis chinensis]